MPRETMLGWILLAFVTLTNEELGPRALFALTPHCPRGPTPVLNQQTRLGTPPHDHRAR